MQMEIILDTTIENAIAFLAGKFSFDLLILYGSYANDLNNAESDIDMIGFADVPDCQRRSDSSSFHRRGLGSVNILSHICQGVLVWLPFRPRVLGSRLHLLTAGPCSCIASFPIHGLTRIAAGL